MSLEHIRQKLIEKKLSTLEYFTLAFEAFKNFWKENTLMMVSIFAFIIVSIIIKIVNLTFDEELLVYFRASKIMILWAKIFNVLDVIISISSIFVTV